MTRGVPRLLALRRVTAEPRCCGREDGERAPTGERRRTEPWGGSYSAYDDQLDRTVAIKLIRGAALGEGDGERRRLHREARALARLSHPNVVQ
ncbi:MAG: hypothetical protein KC468_17530, partial [Myxococcales bacterium]|nr:hypothetical protein [Myxococcales bacterium]